MIDLSPLETPTQSARTGSARAVRENQTQQERLRTKLQKSGGELKPLRSARRNLFQEPGDVWGTRAFAKSLRIDVKSPCNDASERTARSVAQALESCGFKARIIRDDDSAWEGVHVESRAEEAPIALLIQGAFRTAGIGAGLTIHDRAAAKRVVVHVGARALE